MDVGQFQTAAITLAIASGVITAVSAVIAYVKGDAFSRPEKKPLLRWATTLIESIQFFFLLCLLLLGRAAQTSFLSEASLSCLVLILVQEYIRISLESRSTTEKNSVWHQFLLLSGKWFGLCLAGTAATLGVFLSTVFITKQLGLSPPNRLMSAGAITFIAVAGMFYLLSPLVLQLLLRCRKITDPQTVEMLESCFKRAQVRVPSLWLIEVDPTNPRHAHNAMVAGMPSGRGIFRQALFLSSSLFTTLEKAELEAVILHEASHIALRHAPKRLLNGFLALFASCATFVAIALICRFVLPLLPPVFGAMGGLFLMVWVQFSMLRNQVHRQELEADGYAVFRLKADFSALSSALEKLSLMNGLPLERKDPSSYLDPSAAHPTAKQRIQSIKQKMDKAA